MRRYSIVILLVMGLVAIALQPARGAPTPVLAWAAELGGAEDDQGLGVAVDGAGNVYTTGNFRGKADFDPGPGVFNLTAAGHRPPRDPQTDVFVSKLDSAGNLVWARHMGGIGNDSVFGMALDGEGNVYTTGRFGGTADFDPGPGVFNLVSVGKSDVFVSKLDSAGNLVWARQFGGADYEVGQGVAVDGAGNVAITGKFRGSVDFDPGPGVFNLTSGVWWTVFVAKLDSAGDFVWAGRLGVRLGWRSALVDPGGGVAVDELGNVYTTGKFGGTIDFDPGPGVFNLAGGGAFVSKLDGAGNFVWARRLGGPTNSDLGTGVAVDVSGNVYTIGRFGGTADFDPGPAVFNLVSAGGEDAFISKLDSAGNLVWARQMGGPNNDTSRGVAVDGSGSVYTTGMFRGTADFDPGPGVFNLAGGGAFVSKLDSSGHFVWAVGMGGSGSDVAVDAAYYVYTTGHFFDVVDVDPGPGVSELAAAGGSDAFVWKLAPSPPPLCNGQPATLSGTAGNDVLVGTSGNDVIHGLAGSDSIRGLAGDDVICGGDDDDTLHGDGGADTLLGEGGNDVLYGAGGDDVLDGGGARDILRGQGGADVLFGGLSRDVLVGGNGNDELHGGPAGDDLRGNTGHDQLYGDGGTDTLTGGPGQDDLDGGRGTDTCHSGETNTNCET